MTPSATATTAAGSSPHTKPALATAIGVLTGILTLLEGYFGSGHIPSAAEVASILAGSGVTLGSVAAFVAHHLGITKAQVSHDVQIAEAEYAQLQPVIGTIEQVPAIKDHLDQLEKSFVQKFHDLAASLPGPAQVDVEQLAAAVKEKIVSDAVKPAPAAAPPAPPAPGQAT